MEFGGLVESFEESNLISSCFKLDPRIGRLVEPFEESFLNSSRFTQDSRIGGIGKLVESSANLIFSPFTQDS